jgi:hypothetical protein
VKRADDRGSAIARILSNDSAAAVAAEVVEGPHHIIAATNNQCPLAHQIRGDEVARIGYVVDMAHYLPVAAEQLLLFGFQHFGAEKAPGRKAFAVPVIRNLGILRFHCDDSSTIMKTINNLTERSNKKLTT